MTKDSKPNPQRVKEMAEMFNKMGAIEREKLLLNIQKEDSVLYEAIIALMFTFNDLGKLPDQSMQVLLSQIHKSDLAIALKTANDEILMDILKLINQLLENDNMKKEFSNDCFLEAICELFSVLLT